jgi:hypothetical protein
MSAIASAWVASITVGNQTAKQLLQFYASHNFGKPGFEFKNSTLAHQLEVTERAIRAAHQFLIEKEFLTKEIRFNSEGRQLTNAFYLNIPQAFIDKFLGVDKEKPPVDNLGGEGERSSSLGGNVVPGEGERSSSLLNNNINNKLNKSTATPIPFRAKSKQQDNKIFADVTKQSNSYGAQSESPEETQRKYEARMRELGYDQFGNKLCPENSA